MPVEVVEALEPWRGGWVVDGTVGAGGHALCLLQAGGSRLFLLGLDRDPDALELARHRLEGFGSQVVLRRATFDRIGEELAALGWEGADGILLDLGVSSMQLDTAERGFSFQRPGPLDMRMGRGAETAPTAAELLARLEEDELARLFRELGEEPHARRIARAVVAAREEAPLQTTDQLARLVERAVPPAARRGRLHPATRVFQALRLAVNDEMGMLERFLQNVPRWLRPGGRLVVISYHSLEDRRVKQAMAAWARPCTCPPELPVCVCGRRPLFTLPRRKALRPRPQEVAANPRARSARLRVAIRTREAAP